MKFASVALAALLCASAATAQQEPSPDLAPLVPPAAAPAKKAQKKATRKKPAQAAPPPAAQVKPSETTPAQPQASAEAPLPALVPLAEPPPLVKLNNSVGVLAPASLSTGLRAIAQLAPLTQNALALTSPAKPCADEACFADLGARSQVDQVVVATQESGMVRVRLIDVVARRQAGAGEAAVRSDEEALAQAEAISCRLLVPAGCTGDFSAEAPAGVELTVDGAPLSKKLPVGMHTLSARSGTSRTQRAVAVLRERPASYTVDRNLRILAAGESSSAPVAAVASGATPQKSPWVKRGGYALLGAGAVALVAGAAFGLKSRSDLSSAETAYRNNGGVYRASDAETLRSGNSEARNANLLYAASAVCLVTGALLTFAF